jgi:acetyl esterase
MLFERTVSEYAVRSLMGTLDVLGYVDGAVPEEIELCEIEVDRDVSYGSDPRQRLDLYRPVGVEPRALVIYVHGGGFRTLSKETHRPMARILARAGYAVANIDYRLAPEAVYPAAPQDAVSALRWLAERADEYDFPLDRIIWAGESAGANIATSAALASSYETDEPWAREAFELGLAPWGVVPICGLLQVSDPERLDRDGRLPSVVRDRLFEASRDYLPDTFLDPERAPLLADPVRFLEQAGQPDRPLPWFFAASGTRDPVIEDTRRLTRAVEALGGDIEERIYPGEVHSFHAFLWRSQARELWRDWLGAMELKVDGQRPDGVELLAA